MSHVLAPISVSFPVSLQICFIQYLPDPHPLQWRTKQWLSSRGPHGPTTLHEAWLGHAGVHIDARNLTFSWQGFQKFKSFLLLYITKKWAESLTTKASIHWPFESACVSILLTSDAGEHLEAPTCAAGNCKANSVAKMGQGSAVLSPIARPVANLVLVSPFGKQRPLLRWLGLLITACVYGLDCLQVISHPIHPKLPLLQDLALAEILSRMFSWASPSSCNYSHWGHCGNNLPAEPSSLELLPSFIKVRIQQITTHSTGKTKIAVSYSAFAHGLSFDVIGLVWDAGISVLQDWRCERINHPQLVLQVCSRKSICPNTNFSSQMAYRCRLTRPSGAMP